MKVLSIIVTYNGMHWIDTCLQSLLNSEMSTDIFVVDNNSTDQTAAHIQANYREVIFHPSTINLGFGKANNIGLQYALQYGYDAVLLLNQDAFLAKDALALLMPFLEKHPQVGIWSPFHKSYDGSRTETYFNDVVLQNYTPSYNNDLINNQLQICYKSSFIHAACWLMPIQTIKKVGGFDPLFFHYGEDNDYVQRLHYYNLSIAFVPNSIVYHQGNNATMVAPETTLHFWNNQILLKLKLPSATLAGALLLFLKNGCLFFFQHKPLAKKAFLQQLKNIAAIVKARKTQLQPFAFLPNLKL